jgi:hypothetical protein
VTTVKCHKCGAVENLDPIADPGQRWIVKPVHFTERQWETLGALAKAIPGVGGPVEFLRLAIARFLTSPPRRLMKLAMPTKRGSAVNAQPSFGARHNSRRKSAKRNA